MDQCRGQLGHVDQHFVDALGQLLAESAFVWCEGVAEQVAQWLPAGAGDGGQVVAAGLTVEAGQPVEGG